MAIIGTFTKTDDGYVGTIRTMTINVKAKFLQNSEKANDKAPDYRVFAGGAELGAAWREKDKNGDRDYLAVKLDDPSFSQPVRAALFENDAANSAVLAWSR